MRTTLMLILLAACGGTSGPPEDCEIMVGGVCYAGRAEACQAAGCTLERCSLLRTEPAQVECAADPLEEEEPAGGEPAEGEPEASGPCNADEQHCCQPDGTVVSPGGCQPMYRDGDVPNIHRGPDGRCVPDEEPCHLRCLPEDARIATPRGPIPVHRLEVGEVVYSEDREGARIQVPILRVGAVALEGVHALVDVQLGDGRRVRASGPHPTGDGRALGSLAVGDALDGATVIAVEVTPYGGAHTHDILPAGPTGVYWADGVRLGSTLSP